MAKKGRVAQLTGMPIRRGKKPASVGFVLSAPGDDAPLPAPRLPRAQGTESQRSPVPPIRAITNEFERARSDLLGQPESSDRVVQFKGPEAGLPEDHDEALEPERRAVEAKTTEVNEPPSSAKPDAEVAQSLVQALRGGEIATAETLFGQMTGLKQVEVLRILYGRDGVDLALACRALGLEQLQFVSIFIMTRKLGLGEEALDPGALARVVAQFDAVVEEDAIKTLTRWREKEAS